MRQHLDSHIKPLMEQHPALGRILSEAGIGCTSCSLGTCRIQDILEIHNLDDGATRELLTRMGHVIYGDAAFEVPELSRKAAPEHAGFCPPIARMVEEHVHIKRLIAQLPELLSALRRNVEAAAPLAEGVLEVIRNYADRYHHAKEEDILFGFFDPDSDILRVMCQDHADGRAHVRAVAEGLAARDLGKVEEHLLAYGELLSGHIQREDTILYPWMDRTLTDHQVGELFARCMAVESTFGAAPRNYEAFVAGLAARLQAC